MISLASYNYFLLVGLRTYPILDSQCPQGFISYPHTFLDTDDVAYSVVLIKEEEPVIVPEEDQYFSLGMILISSKKALNPREGLHYVHAIETLLPISYFCNAKIYDRFSILPLRRESYEKLTRPWKFTEIVKECREEIADFYNDSLNFSHSFHSQTIERLSWIEYVIPYLKRYTVDPDFQRGCSYLFLSMWELDIDACDWQGENYDPEFYRFVSICRAESAFLNAFKVVEAIVGEPSKNRTRQKLTQKLRQRGINPDEKVGYRVKEKLTDKVLKYHLLRDQIAAHGIGKIKRELKLSEIIDLQSLARYLLLSPAK